MKKFLATMIVLAALVAALPTSVQAQPCQTSYPAELHLGESACIQVCAFQLINFFLVGADLDEVGIPVITALPGCNPSSTPCQVIDCDPIVPPTFFVQGGGIFFPSPNDWAGSSDCMEIAYRWNHDGFWEIEIFPLCSGCFCLSFDDQLAAELSSFDAVAGDNQVSVTWTTASESDIDHFNVLRDNVKVHEASASNSATGHNYSWVDASVANGVTYTYTLEAVDVNGAVEVLGATSATPNAGGLVAEYALAQNYPNPFNPETNISFSLPVASNVSLRVFNLLGQEVATLVNGTRNAGTHVVNFSAADLTSGVYIYRLEADGFSATRKMILMK